MSRCQVEAETVTSFRSSVATSCGEMVMIETGSLEY